MSERDWADRFSRDVDSLLDEAGRTDSEPLPVEYHQALDLARTLATTDFSAESRVRLDLRRRLLNQIGAPDEWQLRKEIAMRALFWRRHPAVTLVAIVLIALLVVTLAWPAAAQGGIDDLLQRLIPRRHPPGTLTLTVCPDPQTETYRGPVKMTFQLVNPIWAIPAAQTSLPKTPITERRGDYWVIWTAIGGFADVLPDRYAAVRHFSTYDVAQAAVFFGLRQPGYLPAGYVFREAMLAPIHWTFLFYDGPDGDIILAQKPAFQGERPNGETGHFTPTSVEVRTNKPIETVTLNGRPAGWIDGYGLIWETESISYILGGTNLSLDEATRIAESLE